MIQFYSAIIESVLCTSITVWFSSATKSDLRRLRRVVRTAEQIIGTTLPTPHSPRTVLIQSEQKGWKNLSGPSHPAHSLFKLLPSGQRYRALSTRTIRDRNSFFPQAIHLINVEHTTLLYIYLFTTLLYFFFISNLHMSDLTHNCLYCILCFCHFVHCVFVYCSCVVCVLSCCCHSVALWSFCHYNNFLLCVNIPGQ